MALSIDGNDIAFTGTVRIVNGFNPDTGVAYMILTPDGGVGALPFLAQGLPGLPPVFDSIQVVEVAPGGTLPSPNPVVTTVSPGGSGVASHLSLKFYIHAGATGATGTNVISTASDLATSPALGSSTNGYTITYRSSDGKWVPTPFAALSGNTYPSPPILATPNNNASPRLITQVNVPAQLFSWRPKPFGQTVVDGGILTRVDLIARLNDLNGPMVGFAKGVTSSEPPTSTLIPAYPPGSDIPGSYALVPAGQPATIYLQAEQKNATIFPWSTPASPDTTFHVDVQPVL